MENLDESSSFLDESSSFEEPIDNDGAQLNPNEELIISNLNKIPDSNLLEILVLNCDHARHIEDSRLKFLNIYLVIVAGSIGLLESSFIQSSRLIIFFLCIISILGLVVTSNLSAAFNNHISKAREITSILKVDHLFATGLLKSKKGLRRVFMKPWEYYILYLSVLLFGIFLLFK